MNTYGLHRGTLTTDFIRSCPLIQSDDAKVRTSPNNKQRRMGVSERNEYDRYIFKVVFSYHLVTHVIDNYLWFQNVIDDPDNCREKITKSKNTTRTPCKEQIRVHVCFYLSRKKLLLCWRHIACVHHIGADKCHRLKSEFLYFWTMIFNILKGHCTLRKGQKHFDERKFQ